MLKGSVVCRCASVILCCSLTHVQKRFVYMLGHGCARVAHCVTAKWRNFSHYCRPLRHYDVWLRVLITEKHWQSRRQHTVYRNKCLEFATEQAGKLRYVTAVDGELKRFPWVAWFAHPCFSYSEALTKHGRLARWRKWRASDVGEVKEGFEDELWRWWSNGTAGEWAVT